MKSFVLNKKTPGWLNYQTGLVYSFKMTNKPNSDIKLHVYTLTRLLQICQLYIHEQNVLFH